MVLICLGFCSSVKSLYTVAMTDALGIKRSTFSINDATNAFELFLDYGNQIKARSKAMQTLLFSLPAAEMAIFLQKRQSREGTIQLMYQAV